MDKKETLEKEKIIDDLTVQKRRERRGNNISSKNEEYKDRRSGDDRRNDNFIGGRRKTDLTKEEAEAFEKILSGGDGEKTLRNLEKKNYINLNDEAKKVEIKRTISLHNLSVERLTTLLFLVILATIIIVMSTVFINNKINLKKVNESQVFNLKQKLDKELQQKVDTATLKNLDKELEK